jgi:cytochrome bd ubiquinol oxidase subunit I
MVGLGTFFIAILVFALFALWRGRLYNSPLLLWALMLLAPFPYIATTFGWMTAELGRHQWVIYGLMRTAQGISPQVSQGNVLFTLIGFFGMYGVLSLLFLFLIYFELDFIQLQQVNNP